MRSFYLFFLLTYLLLNGMPLYGQINPPPSIKVTPVTDIERLVKEVFIKEGDCAQVFNIKSIGRLEGIGSFETHEDSIVMEVTSGIAFSTGDLINIVGPNERNNTTGVGDLNSSDKDLRGLAVRTVFDATGIEFDFIPTNPKVTFNYVFASEEYCEFVNDQFNDVFGFFVSGPGLNGAFSDGAVNVALIPETNDRVAINSVNHLKNSHLFIPNFLDIDIRECRLPPRVNPLRDIEFDGFTRRFQASFKVVPCETYHIRLVVGDVADNILDSGVFLEANSFDIGSGIEVESRVIGSEGKTLYEDCLEGEFIFQRQRFLSPENKPFVINYQILGDAVNGEDYELIGNRVTIPIGQRSATVPIRGILDQLDETTEKVELVTELTSCDCIERDTAVLFIGDQNNSLDIELPDEEVCIGQEFTLSPTILNGIGPYRYEWSTGDTTAQIQGVVQGPSTYTIKVEDFCGGMDSLVARVEIQDVPGSRIYGETDWCEGLSGKFLPVELEGNGPWTILYSINDTAFYQIDGIENSPFQLPVEAAGTYRLEAFSDKQCEGITSGVAQVNGRSFDIRYDLKMPSCQQAQDGEIRLILDNTLGPYQINWDTLTENPLVRTGVGAGEYSVQIESADGCIENLDIQINTDQLRSTCFFSRKMLFIPNAFSPNGDGINDVFQVFPREGTFRSLSFQIFDRWGGLIFESPVFKPQDQTISWSANNTQVGVYLCMVTVELLDGSFATLSEEVHLMR